MYPQLYQCTRWADKISMILAVSFGQMVLQPVHQPSRGHTPPDVAVLIFVYIFPLSLLWACVQCATTKNMKIWCLTSSAEVPRLLVCTKGLTVIYCIALGDDGQGVRAMAAIIYHTHNGCMRPPRRTILPEIDRSCAQNTRFVLDPELYIISPTICSRQNNRPKKEHRSLDGSPTDSRHNQK